MLEMLKLLGDGLVVLDLGSAHSKSLFQKHEAIAKITTLIEIDALGQENVDNGRLHRRISLKKAVSGRRGKRVFTRRKFPDCSSFPEPDPRLIEAYGIQSYFEKVGTVELECETIGVLLQECGVSR